MVDLQLIQQIVYYSVFRLYRELWCQSVNTGVWWKIVKLYSTSLAVMSVIGYIIGLGDRHLDNVLVHLSTGEVSITENLAIIVQSM